MHNIENRRVFQYIIFLVMYGYIFTKEDRLSNYGCQIGAKLFRNCIHVHMESVILFLNVNNKTMKFNFSVLLLLLLIFLTKKLQLQNMKREIKSQRIGFC